MYAAKNQARLRISRRRARPAPDIGLMLAESFPSAEAGQAMTASAGIRII